MSYLVQLLVWSRPFALCLAGKNEQEIGLLYRVTTTYSSSTTQSLYLALLNFTQSNSSLLYTTVLYYILLYFTLLAWPLLCSAQLYSILLYSILPYSTLLYSTVLEKRENLIKWCACMFVSFIYISPHVINECMDVPHGSHKSKFWVLIFGNLIFKIILFC